MQELKLYPDLESTSHAYPERTKQSSLAYHTIFKGTQNYLCINHKKNPIFRIENSTIFTHFTILAIFYTNFSMQLKCKKIYLHYTNVTKIELEHVR